MKSKIFFAIFIGSVFALTAFGQRAPRPSQGPPGMPGPPRDGRPGNPSGNRAPNFPAGPQGEWIKPQDTNKDNKLDAAEFQAAIERTFTELDKNGDGTIGSDELPFAPKPPPMGPMKMEQRPAPGQDGKRILPPFFFIDKAEPDRSYSRAEFGTMVRSIFSEMDKNGDGVLSSEESQKMPRREGSPSPNGPPPPPNARFIGAELRFGDKFVKGQPFSAETLTEDTRLLFNGTTVKMEQRGAIYRDGNGRMRREQPLEFVGGVSLVGKNEKPQKLVFINDFETKTQYFLDPNNKIARKNRIPDNPPPAPDIENRLGSKTESDGTKVIEGVLCNLTRTEFEIPAGQIGNENPLKVVSEKCFSPELQMVIMSVHNDPISGIHSFRLVNIKRAEPASELFTVPAGYRIENQTGRAPVR